MKIFSVAQIKAWDAFTIQHEPVNSVDLMERAASACYHWIARHFNTASSFKIFCGAGNNGGDGLAIARLLIQNGYTAPAYLVTHSGTPDFNKNLERLSAISHEIYFLESDSSFPDVTNQVIIDALFGTGLNKPPTGIFLKLIRYLNEASEKVISIDIPSGLYVDKSTFNPRFEGPHAGDTPAQTADLASEKFRLSPLEWSAPDEQPQAIKATYTLSFQNEKIAFLMPENGPYTGKTELLDIQLSEDYEQKENARFEFADKKLISNIYRPRDEFTHKGNYGYACLITGSYGMMGAAVLSATACLRSGVGKLTVYTCRAGYNIIQTAVPEAMCTIFGSTFVKDPGHFENFDVIGIGPGIGRHPSHKELLESIFQQYDKPLVIDADALNVLSENPLLYRSIPAGSILTPHPKEFERLFGKSTSDFDRVDLALKKASELNVFIVLKGHYTFIATPDSKGYFNSTGNAGMATAGSGDVLTGMIAGLLAQKYSSLQACILGVYLHGLAGDMAAQKLSPEALVARDIIRQAGAAFVEIAGY